MAHFGLLNINKPTGVTSRWVVDRVQRLVRPDKAGHAGTLDPLATGVLVVAVGQATRLIEYVQAMRKRYRGTFLLGRSSSTEDITGDVTELTDPPIPTLEQIEQTAAGMVGEIWQRPPAFSALKVGGQRAYDLARAGVAVELAVRPVDVFRIDVPEYAYPHLVLDIECGGGTYVRTLGRELAESLGSCAVMSALERTAIGLLRVEDAIDVDSVSKQTISAKLLPAVTAVKDLPSIEVDDVEIKRLSNGLPIESRELPAAEEIAAIAADGRLMAIVTADPRGLRPLRFFRRED
jgi:tRNA pseudouridine55 synthase